MYLLIQVYEKEQSCVYILCFMFEYYFYILNAYILLKIKLGYQKKIALLENKLVFIWFRNLKSNILLTFANVPIFSWPNLNSLSSTVHKALSYTNFFFVARSWNFMQKILNHFQDNKPFLWQYNFANVLEDFIIKYSYLFQ